MELKKMETTEKSEIGNILTYFTTGELNEIAQNLQSIDNGFTKTKILSEYVKSDVIKSSVKETSGCNMFSLNTDLTNAIMSWEMYLFPFVIEQFNYIRNMIWLSMVNSGVSMPTDNEKELEAIRIAISENVEEYIDISCRFVLVTEENGEYKFHPTKEVNIYSLCKYMGHIHKGECLTLRTSHDNGFLSTDEYTQKISKIDFIYNKMINPDNIEPEKIKLMIFELSSAGKAENFEQINGTVIGLVGNETNLNASARQKIRLLTEVKAL